MDRKKERQTYGAFSEHKKLQEQRLNNERKEMSEIPRNYPGKETDVIAKVIQYCFDTGTVATFKNIDEIAKIIKDNFGSGIISTFKNVVIYNSIGDIIIQYTHNDKDDLTKINTTMVTVKGHNAVEIADEEDKKKKYSENVQGECKTYTMKKEHIRKETYAGSKVVENFSEEILSRCRISNMNDVSYGELSKEGKELFKRMAICSSLFEPVIKKLQAEQVISFNQSELYDMFTEVNYDETLENQDEESKRATL